MLILPIEGENELALCHLSRRKGIMLKLATGINASPKCLNEFKKGELSSM
jgi:hypothetical protein